MTTTILGIIIGIGVMIYAIIEVARGDPGKVIGLKDMYLNMAAFLIVMGGMIASTLIAHPFPHIVRGFVAFFVVFIRKDQDFVSIISFMCDTSMAYAKNGIAGIEEQIKLYKKEDILKDGLTMIVNGYKMEEVQECLEVNIQRRHDREMIDYYVFRTMGKSAPAFGMVGTLVGLIFMMRVLAESPEKIGPFLAVALVATFYGVVFANLIFNPMANKLLYQAEYNMRIGRMEIEALEYIMKKQHPMYIKDRLVSYVPPNQRKRLYAENAKTKK